MKYGLIGRTLKHSYSKEIHNFLGNSEFEIKEIEPEDLDEFMQKKDFIGITVTIPYKESVMKYCKLSAQAERIGSVNTVINKNGVLYGYNTDYYGFLEISKRKEISFREKKVLILGTGGTAKTARAVIEDEGARCIINISRNGENTYNNIGEHYDADIIVNTTPVGMFPNNMETPLDIIPFGNLKSVIDVIYNPLNTELLMQRNDVKTAGGLPMLVAQALYAHNLFFNVNLEDILEEAIDHCTKIFSNFILIGMPGVGKSTTGKKLAKHLDLRFVDTDVEIQKKENRTPKEIIENDGEHSFRKIEAEVIAQICKKGGQVIATGGGSVLHEENRRRMKQNGKIIYLYRDLHALQTTGRPLSQNLEQLFEDRKTIYKEMGDIVIINPKSADDATRKIRTILNSKHS